MSWFGVRVEGGRECRTGEEFSKCGLSVYVPIFHSRSLRRGVLTEIERAAIPGYLFCDVAEMDHSTKAMIAGARYVISLLPNNFTPMEISETAIELMRAECDKLVRSEGDSLDCDWAMGKYFQVTRGAFAGQEALCIGANPRGLILMIAVFRQLVDTTIPFDCLDLRPVYTQAQDFIEMRQNKRYNRKVRIGGIAESLRARSS